MRNIFVMTAKPVCLRNGQALPVICMCGIEVSSTLKAVLRSMGLSGAMGISSLMETKLAKQG